MDRPLKFFVSYARDDQPQVDQLLRLLGPRLSIANGFDFTTWLDRSIVVGNQWRQEIEAAMVGCDAGLLLLSPAFFHSHFITAEELPHFLETTAAGLRIKKPVVPVGLKPIPLDGSARLRGIEQLQIFRDRQARWFSEARGHLRERWVDELTAAIIAKFTATAGGTP